MSIPSSRAHALLLTVAGVATLASSAGCKKNEAPSEPSVAAAGSAVAAPAAPNNAPGAFGKGTIQGTVHFSGKAPEAKAITTPDPYCARKQMKDEELMVVRRAASRTSWCA